MYILEVLPNLTMYLSKPPNNDSCVACRISATSSSVASSASGGYQRFEYRQETEVEGEEAAEAAAGQSAAAAGVEDIRARLERIRANAF